MGLPDFKKIVEDVDEAIRILEMGNVPECLKRYEGIVTELRKSKVVGEALSELIQPFVIHADEYELNEKVFAEKLRSILEC